MGWMVSCPNHPLQDLILLGNWVIADVNYLKWGGTGREWTLLVVWLVSFSKGDIWTQETWNPCEDKGRGCGEDFTS